MDKVFSVRKFIESNLTDSCIVTSLSTRWPQKLDGLTAEEIEPTGLGITDEWMVDREYFIPYEEEEEETEDRETIRFITFHMDDENNSITFNLSSNKRGDIQVIMGYWDLRELQTVLKQV